jgi:primosomal replication protein N
VNLAGFNEADNFTPHFRAEWRNKERRERRERYDMTDKVFDNNQVSIAGEVISDFTFSHDVFGEGFYVLEVVVSRLSNSYDMIPVMVSERLIDVKQDYKGKFVEVLGQFRSYNRHEESKNKLVLSVFAREVKMVDELSENAKPNHIFLDGFVCKPPIYRKTPLGREIADVLLAVNRPYGKSDYIPCICWGRNARFAETFTVGGHVQIWGRIQSREYQKKITDVDFEKRVAYEVSVSKLEYLEEY